MEDALPDHAADRAAIEQLIADVEAGFNAHDAERAVTHFAPDASAVTVRGVHVTGREALLESYRTGFAGPLRDQYARYELADLAFLRPDVAVAHMRAVATTPDGEPIDVGHSMLALYVLVREDGRWWIAARQDTVVS
jgi:uncharacterized protein (TIGR02246 family)